ncbi:tetratricopeptide repeat protein [Agrobacterium pusense]|uniref:tetratricopeptide repeat protein n=1 Tax=Agrobacterium pusense TaxID=648995 RepID=UPI0028682AD6|nr:tetratricopeptide repeat protein [Agrobacterium pusense]WMW57123.1 tetratricopeptide repeat protein [Agrobacterium pusense]
MITKLMKMLEDGRDSPLLRFSIAKALAAAGQFKNAAYHLQAAIRQDPDYSAAWAELGECRARLGDNDGAITAWVEGMSVAVGRGDIQARRQMEVRLRRLRSRTARPHSAA